MNHGITHPQSQGLIDYAFELAEQHHRNQARKYTGEPYINHCVEVAQLVASVTCDVNAICAALCHDLIEDTDVTYDFLAKSALAWPVANLVLEVTDVSRPSDGNRALRKRIDRQYLAGASARGQTIKLADLISNSQSIAQHDPDFAKIYMQEKSLLLPHLKKGDETLWHRAHRIYKEYRDNTNGN